MTNTQKQPVRVAVTGRKVSPPLFESLGILGRDSALARLDRFAAVGITVEPSSGSEVPTTDTLVGVDLDPTAHTGPRYGGRPSTN